MSRNFEYKVAPRHRVTSKTYADIAKSEKSEKSENIEFRKTVPIANSSKNEEVSNIKSEKKFKIPAQVLKQKERCDKYKYIYKTDSEGNIKDNTTLYVYTNLAYQSNVIKIFDDAIAQAKRMPEIFGDDFECEYKINLVKTKNTYVGYAFITLTNPALYYALLGYTADGKDRAEYIDDPDWIPVPKTERSITKSTNWADMAEEEDEENLISGVPKIRIEKEPLIKLDSFIYDEEQKQFAKPGETEGKLIISPGYITPGLDARLDPTCLYVSDVPEMNYELLYDIFSIYAKTCMSSTNKYFPNIKIHNKNGKYYAIVKYDDANDAGFALAMTKKIRLLYKEQEVTMTTKYAFRL